ncbi:MAG: penicillin-binding protein 2 [Nitrospiraceae bacterium]|nr:MAG: penicillin-binding protein 2 [Nitrospiraceae bacterium]
MMRRKNTGNTEMRKLWDEDPVKIPLQKSKKRGLVLVTIVFFCFAVILFRLVDLMVVDHEKLSERAAQQYMREKTLTPQRGVIWDRKMKEMAANIETESLYAMPSKVEDTRSLTRDIAPLIKVSSKRLNRTLLKKKNKDFIWLERKMDLDNVRKINVLKEKNNYKAIGFLSESKRFYPKNKIASHLIGFTNIDNKGISGLELQYDTYLRGEISNFSVGTDARGNRLFNEVREPVSGNNLLLTIDERIQYIVERELADAMKTWKAEAAVAIMMNPATGEILAMANRPNYDPNSAGRSKVSERRNRALTDLFEPGSTLKTVLAAAALEEGIVRLNDEYDVSKGYIVVGGKRIRDLHKNDILTFQEVVQRSSNVGAVQIGMELGGKKYYEYIRKFGFGEKSGIDFPGEIKGILRNPRDWSGTSLAALSIGQEIGVTPLQILRAYAAIANGGKLMKPYIVSDIISPAGQIIKSVAPEVVRQVVSEKTAEKVTDILKTVVEEGGTATKAYIQGNLVAGKTGTAQIFDNQKKRYSRERHISSFVGFVPADDPRLALIVVIYEPKGGSYGGVVAAPVFKNIIEHTFAYMNVPMERDENQIILVSRSR